MRLGFGDDSWSNRILLGANHWLIGDCRRIIRCTNVKRWFACGKKEVEEISGSRRKICVCFSRKLHGKLQWPGLCARATNTDWYYRLIAGVLYFWGTVHCAVCRCTGGTCPGMGLLLPPLNLTLMRYVSSLWRGSNRNHYMCYVLGSELDRSKVIIETPFLIIVPAELLLNSVEYKFTCSLT